MTISILQDYIKNIKDLNRNKGIAPHKPFLLLIIIEMIESGELYENNIPFSEIHKNKLSFFEDLIEAFNESKGSQNWQPNIHTPFFHLKTNGFWHLNPRELQSKSTNTTPTVSELRNANASAKLDEELFDLLTAAPECREIIRQTIINTYFPNLRQKIEDLTIEDDAKEYSELLINSAEDPFPLRIDVESIKIETPSRSAGFRRSIMKIYEYKCAVCKLNIRAANGESITDAAHIIPFHILFDNHVKNGISLCKSHHWAFDANLFSLSETYQIIVSPYAREHESTQWIRELRDKSIWLPNDKKYHPAKYAMKWHRERMLRQ